MIHYSISDDRRLESISLFDFHGQLLIMDADRKEEGQMDVTGLTEGVYLMKFLMDDGEVVCRKVVKQ